MSVICLKCNVAIMEPHYMLKWWKKCPVCGYCAHDPKWFPKHKESMIKKDKMLKNESFLERKLNSGDE